MGSGDLLLYFLEPIIIWGTIEARNFKFGTKMEVSEYLRQKLKLGQKGLRDSLLEFWNPSISETIEAKIWHTAR